MSYVFPFGNIEKLLEFAFELGDRLRDCSG